MSQPMLRDAPRQSLVSQAEFAQAVADEAALRAALMDADPVPQLLLQAQLSGDTDLLDQARSQITGGWNYMHTLSPAMCETIRERLIATLKQRAQHTPSHHDDLSPAGFARTLSTGVGAPVGDDYVQMLLEEFNAEKVDARSVAWRRTIPAAVRAKYHVLIIGAGLSGLCMGIKLREAGIPFTIFEKNATVGGTWYENNYPGCAVDIPNHFYSYAFEPNAEWSRHFARRDELWKYLEHCADKYDLRRHIRFQTEVVAARYDDAQAEWQLTLRDTQGKQTHASGRILVPAVGQLNRPAIPNIEGIETFGGPVFHTARWDTSVDLRGQRVAMVGTGASGMQVGPTIAPAVAQLTIFQRGRHWCFPHPNYHRAMQAGTRWALANIPYFASWYRALLFWASGDLMHPLLQVDPTWTQPEVSLNAESHAFREKLLAHIHAELADRPDLIEKTVPTFPPYGKRMLRDNGWFQLLKRDNVALVEGGVARVEPGAVIDRHGQRHAADIIVLATGFQATRLLAELSLVGEDNTNIRSLWGEDNPQAFLGITVPKFPNMFLLQGPNTILSHGGSMFFHTECQVRYVMQCVRELIEGGHAAMQVRAPVYEEFNRRVDAAHAQMVWAHPGVNNWYKNPAGRVTAVSPWRLVDYWKMTAALDPSHYRFAASVD